VAADPVIPVDRSKDDLESSRRTPPIDRLSR